MTGTSEHLLVVIDTGDAPARRKPSEKQLEERLNAIRPDLKVTVCYNVKKHSDISDELWKSASVLFTLFVVPPPQKAPHLKFVQVYSAGINQVADKDIYKEDNGIVWATASGVHGPVIAEHVIMMILAWRHHLLHSLASLQFRKEWPRLTDRVSVGHDEIYGATVGILGYGAIGRDVAHLLSSFSPAKILALNHTKKTTPEERKQREEFQTPGTGDPEGLLPSDWYGADELNVCLEQCDILVISSPLTDATRGLISEDALKHMKSRALIVNIARGEIIDQDALISALKEGRIGGACLDVMTPEPLPKGHPLLDAPNVILTPHIAGFSRNYHERAVQVLEINLQRLKEGKKVINRVNKEKGY